MTVTDIGLDDRHAEALAIVCKRFGYSDAKSLSKDAQEADAIMAAIVALRDALWRAGWQDR